MRILVFCLLFSFSPFVFAGSKHNCEDHLSKRLVHVIGSGRNADAMPKLHEAFDLMFSTGGVLDQLHLSMGPEIVATFVQGTELDALASASRPPAGHWIDGQNIIKMLSGRGLIYEFVSPGCGVQHSFYRDTLDVSKQISIVMHVAGHYHFNRHSRFPQVRQLDIPKEGSKLYDMLENFYRLYDHDEVSSWYQKLESLSMAQDLSRGTFDSIEKFPMKNPSASVLQGFVANLPATLPKWKLQLALQFEKIHRYYSGAVPTKIMNEGWASLMQELVPEHTPFSGFSDALEFSELMTGVARPSLSNPYFLGREAWRRVRKRFNQRPEIQNLTPIARDAAFVDYATKEFIEKFDDFDFLQVALDDQWVTDHRLSLSRNATSKERIEFFKNGGFTPPPEADLKFPTLKTIISKDPKRILRGLAKKVADHRASTPRVLLLDTNEKGKGIVTLGFDDQYGKTIPLNRASTVMTLYIYSHIIEKPVAIDTVGISTWSGFKIENEETQDPDINWEDDFDFPQPPNASTFPIRIQVSPDGKVEVYLKEKSEFEFVPEASEELQKVLAHFIEDLAFSEHDDLVAKNKEKFGEVTRQFSATLGSKPSVNYLLQAPTSPRAISEYLLLIKRRLAPALLKAFNGKSRIIRGNGGVKIKALPTVPFFQFDSQAKEILLRQTRPPSVDLLTALRPGDGHFRTGLPAEDAADIDQSQKNPGDIYWGEGRPPEGQEGDGDGDNGDGDGNLPGENPGDIGNDPTLVDIPDDIYTKALGVIIELPRLRPKSGLIFNQEEEYDSSTQRRTGNTVYEELRKKVFKLGIAKSQAKVENPIDLLFKGLRSLQTHHWTVQETEPVKSPDFNAHVTIAVDMSGSMYGDRLKAAKRMSYDLRLLLLNKYKEVHFSFVAFDGNGHVFDSIDDFIRANLGGGTDYTAGLKTAIQEQEKFPRNKWDRYFVGMGDLEDFGEPAVVMQYIQKITEQSEFSSMVGISEIADKTVLGIELQKYAVKEPWFGFAHLKGLKDYTPRIFNTIFKNEKSK